MMDFKIFRHYDNLAYGLSGREDGSMRVIMDDSEENARSKENKEVFFNSAGIRIERVVAADLRHSAKVMVVGDDDAGKIIPETDGLVTAAKDLFLSVTGADCPPVYFYDGSGVVGIAHAGWRGVARGIIPNIVGAMIESGAKKETILAGTGPGIQKCHFEVRSDVLEYFGQYSGAIIRRDSKIFIDLPAIIIDQLARLGVSADRTENSDRCTFCAEQKYFSYRRDKILNVMAAYIGTKE